MMQNNHRHIVSLLLGICLSLFLTTCSSDSRPSDIMPEDELVPVLKDLEIAYAGVDQTVKDPRKRQKKYEEMNSIVLKKYNVEKEHFYSSYQWYESQPVLLDSIFKLVLIELNHDLVPLQNKGNTAPGGKVPEVN